ncbi:transcriptional regulator [Methylobacterium sp. Leaf99]|jgi:putative two-component system response regulator|uniref:HD-GYP domain-containing protein n=1 Tax=unclassified Methylobacterium TaxID=2615210 RepID=UPI0006F4147E|nr:MULTISPECIES: HD domain-containing phosphohydrolase [unclassified Methylobacterium]KQP07407.1 transcriptional regulator [Methylobacterium sp. Leaf99]TXM77501.1 response regulator [Methylobacterium sp. WL69]
MFVLVLDDAPLNNMLMAEAIRTIPDCTVRDFTRPADALAFVEANSDAIGVAISDYDMPGMNGVAFIRAARAVPGFAHVPVVMVTSLDQRSLRREALEAGATDFLAKPFDPIEIRARVSNLLALNRARIDQRERAAWLDREVRAATALIAAREREIVLMLMKAAEHRDNETGNHVARVAGLVALIARGLDLSDAEVEQLSLASTMHDVGKISVPDTILLKPGPLTQDERREMERHAERGRRILEGSSSLLMQRAAEIAATHHERWDGSGYPAGLAGEAIPLSGRIVAVADVFDALTSDRPYKKAWSEAEALNHIRANAGSHFDPACVAAFVRMLPKDETPA